jgi:hypothetical protein
MPPLHLLGEYESLTRQHQEQFAPALTQLQASVDQMLHQLRRQEQSLVEAQAKQLAQLHTQLATDTRCLLNSIELQSFISQVPARCAGHRPRCGYGTPQHLENSNPFRKVAGTSNCPKPDIRNSHFR